MQRILDTVIRSVGCHYHCEKICATNQNGNSKFLEYYGYLEMSVEVNHRDDR